MFSRVLIGYSNSRYPVLFTDSSPGSERLQTPVSYEQNGFPARFAALTNEDISQINEEAVPEKHKGGSFYR